MAIAHTIISDLSGAPDAATVTLGLDAEWRVVDLTEAERAELDELLRPYWAASREPDRPVQVPKRFVPDTTREERDAIKDWARRHGYHVAARGVIPKRVYRAYKAAHPSEDVDA
ncbi:Lsr2 family DNA-binding protein [Brachybacterium hainanense]|uniref:Histone-like nucleoid-structuring protein Lsr2 n=1 Tax=Brachybacterium hainanense TaxID=1541174 RepID=A0ABV6RF77_9MICO